MSVNKNKIRLGRGTIHWHLFTWRRIHKAFCFCNVSGCNFYIPLSCLSYLKYMYYFLFLFSFSPQFPSVSFSLSLSLALQHPPPPLVPLTYTHINPPLPLSYPPSYPHTHHPPTSSRPTHIHPSTGKWARHRPFQRGPVPGPPGAPSFFRGGGGAGGGRGKAKAEGSNHPPYQCTAAHQSGKARCSSCSTFSSFLLSFPPVLGFSLSLRSSSLSPSLTPSLSHPTILHIPTRRSGTP